MLIGKTRGQVAIDKNAYKPLKEFKGDTLGYFTYNFVDHKKIFIDKNLSVLLDKLEFKIIDYLPSFTAPSQIGGVRIYLDKEDINPKKGKNSNKRVMLAITYKEKV